MDYELQAELQNAATNSGIANGPAKTILTLILIKPLV